MRNLWTLLVALGMVFSSAISLAQSTSGVIKYEEKVNQWMMLPPDMAERMKEFMDQYSSTFFRLYFDESGSIYKALEDDQPQADAFSGGGFPGGRGEGRGGFGGPPGGGRGRFGQLLGASSIENKIHVNLETNTTTAIMQGIEGTYYMEDPIAIAPWKFGPEKRTILGYECNVAYYTDNSNPEKPLEITAWYTTRIKPFVGPDYYNTLPGAILALDVNAGEQYWVAREIQLRELNEDEAIEKPEPGKDTEKTTYVEYKQLQEESRAAMSSRFNRGGR